MASVRVEKSQVTTVVTTASKQTVVAPTAAQKVPLQEPVLESGSGRVYVEKYLIQGQ